MAEEAFGVWLKTVWVGFVLSNDNGVEAVEVILARRMVLLGLPLSAIVVAASTIGWGSRGLYSSLIGSTFVLLNLSLSAVAIAKASKVSTVAAMAVAMSSFIFDLLFLTVFVVVAHGYSFMNIRVFAFSLITVHIVVTAFAARGVSGRVAYSGLFPSKKGRK